MYGVESCVHPDYRGCGVGGRLMDARFQVLKQLNLRGMVASGAIIDYHKAAHEVTPEQYVQDVIAKRRFDTNLTKQLHKGFEARQILPNHLSDPESCGYAVCIVWTNPDYQPARRPRWGAASRRPALKHKQAVL
jgi:hypothetical protein